MSEIEKLLEIMEAEGESIDFTPDPVEPLIIPKSIKKFIDKREIKRGTLRVSTHQIYSEYRNFVSRRTEFCGKTEFFRHFSKLFEQKRTKKQRYYLLDKEISCQKEAKKNTQR